jgi:cell division protein FtsL
MLLVVAALVFTAYIANIITVDRLSVSMTDLERREQRLLRDREALRAQINILSSYTRIQQEAAGLDLVHATQQPFSITVPGLRQDDAAADAGERL